MRELTLVEKLRNADKDFVFDTPEVYQYILQAYCENQNSKKLIELINAHIEWQSNHSQNDWTQIQLETYEKFDEICATIDIYIFSKRELKMHDPKKFEKKEEKLIGHATILGKLTHKYHKGQVSAFYRNTILNNTRQIEIENPAMNVESQVTRDFKPMNLKEFPYRIVIDAPYKK